MSHDSIFNPLTGTEPDDPLRSIASIDPKLSRTNYYDGRLLKASDLIRDQLYLDERLREVGRAMGYGIVRGLEIALSDEGVLSVRPGLGVAPSGRVLELEDSTLRVSLYDAALIAALNPGYRRLERGLYAVLIQYAETGEGSAEIYPRDLEGERGFHFNAYAEGVEITLSPLRVRAPLLRSDPAERLASSISARAALVPELIGGDGHIKGIAEDGLALGLLAIENGRPQWLDRGLLRRPHRAPNDANRLQRDLHTHYQELLRDVLQMRRQSLRQQEFPAAHYFNLLPPYGSVPRDSVNPELGRQSYFPEGFEVSIAPVREDDLDAILGQSAGLEPIDLKRDKDVDIMLLVPMNDHQFAWRARQLEHEPDDFTHTQLAHLDNLALRLYERPNVHQSNTDAAVWRGIWEETDTLLFVRRPTRVAETQVSAVVLAAGYGRPVPGSAPPADMEAIEQERQRLTTLVQDLQIRIAELEDVLNDSVDERLAEAQARMRDLEAQISELNRQLAEAANDRATIRDLSAERDQLRNDLDAARAEIERLNSDSDSGDSAQQIADLQAALASAQQDLTAANRTIDELRAQGGGDYIAIQELIDLRAVRDSQALQAAAELNDNIADVPESLRLINLAVALFSRDYDRLLWSTLVEVVKNRRLSDFVKTVSNEIENSAAEHIVAANGSNWGISDELVKQWDEFQLPRGQSLGSSQGSLTERIEKVEALSVEELATQRNFNNSNAVTTVAKSVAQPENLRLINQIAALVDSRYETALWATLPSLNRNDNLEAFRDYLIASMRAGLPIGTAIAARSNTLKLSTRQRALWANVDMKV